MRQKSLRKGQEMDGATLVLRTRRKLTDLVKDESRGWGDESNALQRIAQNMRVSTSYLWRLLYKRDELKDVRGSVLLKIHLAHEAMRERQQRKFDEEFGEAAPETWLDKALVSAASALARTEEEGDAE